MKRYFKWVVVLATLGLADSIWLLILHLGRGAISSGCSISPGISCEATYDEKYSVWFGVPVPVFSILYFGLLIAIAVAGLRGRSEKDSLRPKLYLWLMGWLGLGSALYMAFIAMVVLKTFCPYCAVLWVILAWLCGVAWRTTKDVGPVFDRVVLADLRQGYRSPWFWGVGLISAAVLVSSWALFSRQEGRLVGPAATIVGEEARSLGPVGARVAIAVYSDFQCPWCRMASEILLQLSQEMPRDLRVVFKFFPLDSGCNESIARPMHAYACAASFAAYCASVQGKFWDYHDYLFTSQNDLPEKRLREFAQSTQIDLAKFDACRRDPRTKEEIVKNVREGMILGVSGTPSIFINGRKYAGPITLSALRDTVAGLK